jgi:hypothetical protein
MENTMWTPKSLLHPDTLLALKQAEFPPTKIEFLGWLSYNAAALNNSRNPVKAAHTLLGKEKNVEMLKKFIQKKKDSLHPPDVPDHSASDDLCRQFDRWVERNVPQEEVDHYDPETEHV